MVIFTALKFLPNLGSGKNFSLGYFGKHLAFFFNIHLELLAGMLYFIISLLQPFLLSSLTDIMKNYLILKTKIVYESMLQYIFANDWMFLPPSPIGRQERGSLH